MLEPEQPANNSIYQIKVTLEGSNPPIWRRVLLFGDTSLEVLHYILQVVMDWQNYHLHQFVVGDKRYGVNENSMPDPESERSTTLRQVATRQKSRIFYEYDFGDGWEHDILVEKVLQPEEGLRYPVCIEGEHAAPPEDCGGIPGYYMMLEAIEDPEHPDHEDMLEWVGGDFDSATFDLYEINEKLESLR
jgi:hypothetical protein